MVEKDIFPFATMTDGCKKVNFKEFFNKIPIFCENILEVVSKMPYSWENPMKLASLQPSVTVATGKILFATVVIVGCEEAYFMGFYQYIYGNELTSENMYLPMNLAKKSQFHFSFFKVESQNPKFSLEYLISLVNM